MRLAAILLTLFLLSHSGCSSLLARSGLNPGGFESEKQVQRWLGQPRKVAITDQGELHTYHTRWKLANHAKAVAYGMTIGMCYGLAEPFCCGHEIKELNDTLIYGNELEFEFDEDGNVIKYRLPEQDRNENECTIPTFGI